MPFKKDSAVLISVRILKLGINKALGKPLSLLRLG
jgi:hypothetical protein